MKTQAAQPAVMHYICDLSPYQPGLPIDLVARTYGLDPVKIVKLASNENPLGMSPRATAALQRALPEAHRYPEQYNLVQALAKHYQLDPAMIVLGNGSNDVLDLIARIYLNEGLGAISSAYAFAVYGIATQSTGASNVVVTAKNYGHDLQAMAAAITPRTKLIWIANPNNPTGTFVPYAEIRSFLQQVPSNIVVVLDEAYYEYLSDEDRLDSVAWLAAYPNLILVRTFSKIYGLAGLRIGYGLASPEIIAALNRVRQPFNTNVLALAAATAALKDNQFVGESYRLNVAGRRQLQEGLEALQVPHLPAYGNFVTFRVPNARKLNEHLLQQGIIIRPLAAYNMPDWLRVTVGLPAENERFLEALSRVPAN